MCGNFLLHNYPNWTQLDWLLPRVQTTQQRWRLLSRLTKTINPKLLLLSPIPAPALDLMLVLGGNLIKDHQQELAKSVLMEEVIVAKTDGSLLKSMSVMILLWKTIQFAKVLPLLMLNGTILTLHATCKDDMLVSRSKKRITSPCAKLMSGNSQPTNQCHSALLVWLHHKVQTTQQQCRQSKLLIRTQTKLPQHLSQILAPILASIKEHGGKLISANKKELAISNSWAETTVVKTDSRPWKYM